MSKSPDDRYSVTVYLPPKIHEIVTTKLKGSLGKKDSEIKRIFLKGNLTPELLEKLTSYFKP